MDSVSGNGSPVGAVHVYSREEILSATAGIHIHGMNVADSPVAAQKVGLELPRDIRLIGIEVGDVGGFGEDMRPELDAGFETICTPGAGGVPGRAAVAARALTRLC